MFFDYLVKEQIDIRNAQYNLLNEMATALGYKEDILWDAVQKPYLPTGMLNAMSRQEQYQTDMTQILSIFLQQAQTMANNQPNAPKSTNDIGRKG